MPLPINDVDTDRDRLPPFILKVTSKDGLVDGCFRAGAFAGRLTRS